MCVLIFSKTLSKTSHSKEHLAIYCHKCENFSMSNSRYSCRILIKLKSSWQSFEKRPNIKFHQNPSIGNRNVPCRQTDGHDEANSRFTQFCERAGFTQSRSEISSICTCLLLQDKKRMCRTPRKEFISRIAWDVRITSFRKFRVEAVMCFRVRVSPSPRATSSKITSNFSRSRCNLSR